MSEPRPETRKEREEKALATPTPQFLTKLAEKLGETPEDLKRTIFKTCLYEGATAEEFRTFMVVAANLGLNPLAGEVYAFRKRGGGIQVIVGKEGFNTLNNQNPAYDGRRFYYWYQVGTEVKRFENPMDGYPLMMVECHIYRKDHAQPEIAFAKMSEYNRPDLETWRKYPTTMLEHKAFIKASKGAFGYAGAVDLDEAARFCELRSVPPVAADEVRAYSLPSSEGASQATPETPEPNSTAEPGEALATNKQKNYIYGMAKLGGIKDTEELKAFLRWRGTPPETLNFRQADELISKFKAKDYSEIERFKSEQETADEQIEDEPEEG